MKKKTASSPRCGRGLGWGGIVEVAAETPIKQLLVNGAKELGIQLPDSQVDACFQYLSELKKWNRKINLTAIRDDRDIIIKHFLDSFSFLKGFVPREGLRLLDMGSGAGFPALPMKIVHQEIEVTMVESVKKKASFLRHIIRTLDLKGVEILDKRTDGLPDTFHGRYDVVTARAFADMEAALAAGAGFLKAGGLMVLSRGPEEKIEAQELPKAGVTLEARTELKLPLSDYRRVIWVFKKLA